MQKKSLITAFIVLNAMFAFYIIVNGSLNEPPVLQNNEVVAAKTTPEEPMPASIEQVNLYQPEPRNNCLMVTQLSNADKQNFMTQAKSNVVALDGVDYKVMLAQNPVKSYGIYFSISSDKDIATQETEKFSMWMKEQGKNIKIINGKQNDLYTLEFPELPTLDSKEKALKEISALSVASSAAGLQGNWKYRSVQSPPMNIIKFSNMTQEQDKYIRGISKNYLQSSIETCK